MGKIKLIAKAKNVAYFGYRFFVVGGQQHTPCLNARRNAYLSVDGGKAVRLNMGDVVTVRKSDLETKLLRLKDTSFFDVVTAKFRIG